MGGDEDDGMDVYGYREFGAGGKKNRPGQRARRAKYAIVFIRG